MDAPAGGGSDRLADHVEESVDTIAAFHEEHYRSASPLQRAMEAMTAHLGRPGLVALMTLAIVGWIGLTFLLTDGSVQQPSFAWLELAATLAALLVAMLILVTQKRQDQVAERRSQLTLELSILADKKTAKVIALLEELRRDAPGLHDRVDTESDALAKPANPGEVLQALEARAADKRRKR